MTKQLSLPVLDAACCSPLAEEPLTAARADTLAPMFKALGDPVRLRLLSLIASHAGQGAQGRAGAGLGANRGEVCVCELTPRFAQTGPTISHHLKVLREAGLIDCERRGTWVYYWLRPGVLDQLAAVLDSGKQPATA